MTVTSKEQFSGEPPLELGSIRGLRQWRIFLNYHNGPKQPSGEVLVSPVYSAYWWREGENVVTRCNRCWLYVPLEQTLKMLEDGTANNNTSYRDGLYPSIPATIHPGCSCGFYAFTDGRDDLGLQGVLISGIIEGYGRVTVGQRGFRAEKARIVALDLEEVDPAHRRLLRRSYPNVQFFSGRAGMLKEFPLPTAKPVQKLARRVRRYLPW